MSTASPHPGWSEQDPRDWWRATKAAIAGLADQVDLGAVAAVGLSGQMHGSVTLDRNRQIIRPAILWNDNRATEACDVLRERVADIGQLTGILPLPGLTAPKLLWLAEAEPDNFARIAHLMLPKDYVGFCLHDQIATDYSDAAGTLWLDQRNRTWGATLIEGGGIRREWLPQLHHGHEVVGQVSQSAASETGLPAGIPVTAGAGDAAAGAIAMGAVERGRGFISLGTSGQLFLADHEYHPNPDKFVHAFAHTLPSRWFQMAAMLNGARPITWFADRLEVDAGAVAASAVQADDARVPIFLPYLTGERSPHGDPHIRAGFFGIEDATGNPELCRAVLEAVAFTFADAVESFGQSTQGLDGLVAIGGGSRSNLLLQLIANTTGFRIGRVTGSEAGPAIGAAKLAACGTGALSLSDLAIEPVVSDWFTPQPAPELLARLERFRATYQALRQLH